jgi:hypothetical protein
MYKRYVLVPNEDGNNDDLPLFTNLTPVDSLARELDGLNQQKTLSTNQRWQAYRQIFQAYFKHKKAFPEDSMSPGGSSTSSLPSNADIVPAGLPERQKHLIQTSLPRYLSARGKSLLTLVNQRFRDTGIGVSPTSGVLFLNGMPLSGSNISDIISFALRSAGGKAKAGGAVPTGWEFFNRLIPPEEYTPRRRGSASINSPPPAPAKVSSPIASHLRKRARVADGPHINWASYDDDEEE